MKLAICNETFQDWPFEKAFAFAADCGYTGIEIAPFTMATDATQIPQSRRDEVRRQADRAGLEVVGLHWLLAKTEGFHVTSPDAEVRRKTAAYLQELVRLCVDLGGKVMVFGSPMQRNLAPGVSHEQGMEYAAELFRSLVPALEANEVVVALEPLGPQETNFLVTAAETVELAERISSSQVRLHLDCKAMATESIPPTELIRKYHQLTAHFHANDPNRQGPGMGQLDIRPILEALGEVDYRGWVSVEVFDYSPGVERLARESIENLQQCLAEIGAE
jgi:sugar phosphate isomerase/epimerase